MVWYSHLFQNFPEFIVVHTVKGFGIVNKGFGTVNKAEIDVFLELFCFLHDPVDVGNLISGSSVFSNESALCIRWPKYWSFSFSISPSNKYSALISFRIDLFDLLAVQGTLKSLLQHHSSKALILCCSALKNFENYLASM